MKKKKCWDLKKPQNILCEYDHGIAAYATHFIISYIG